MDMTTPMQPKPLVDATCKLGEKGCWKDGKCYFSGRCENKVLSNFEKIQAMTVEELEEFLREVYNTGSKSAEAWYCGEGHRHGFEWTADWLKQPAEGSE